MIITDIGKSFKTAILGIILYILGIYLIKLVTLPLAENLAHRFGFKWIIIFSLLPLFLLIIFLFLAQKDFIFLVVSSVFWGIEAALFWFGYHGLFVKFGNKQQFGCQEGVSQVWGILSSITIPILGSLLIVYWGFLGLFFMVALFALISVLIIIFSPVVKPYHDARIIKVFRLFKTHPKVVGAYLGWGGEGALYGAIWPVFLILIVGDILGYGGIIAGSILLAAVMTYLIGKWVDRSRGKQIVSFGVFLGAFSWLARIIARSPLSIVSVDGTYRLTEQMLAIPMDVFSYKKALEGGTSQALYFREIALNIGAILFLTMAVIIVWMGLPLWSTFILGLVGTLAPILVSKRV
jgi:hypothetical protein